MAARQHTLVTGREQKALVGGNCPWGQDAVLQRHELTREASGSLMVCSCCSISEGHCCIRLSTSGIALLICTLLPCFACIHTSGLSTDTGVLPVHTIRKHNEQEQHREVLTARQALTGRVASFKAITGRG